MKNTISGFNQKKLIEMGLDLKDAMLLRYFVDFRDTESMTTIIIDNKPFYWLKYEHLKEDIPILGITTNIALRRRLKKLEDAGVLEHYHKLEGGSFSYYTLGPKYKLLISDKSEKDFNNFSQEETTQNPQTEKFNPSNSKVQPLKPKSLTPQTEKFKQNNLSTKDRSTKDNIKKEKKKTEFDVAIESYTENESLRETLYEFIKSRKAIKAAMTTLALKKILNRLNTIAENDTEKIQILNNSIMNGWKGIFPLEKEKKGFVSKDNTKSFNNFEARSYDYEELERKLLGWDDEE